MFHNDIDFKNICRICMKDDASSKSIFHYNANGCFEDLSLKMSFCSGTNIKLNDGLPHKICKECVELLNNAYCYKIMITKSEVTLRKILESKSNKEINDNISNSVQLNIDTVKNIQSNENITLEQINANAICSNVLNKENSYEAQKHILQSSIDKPKYFKCRKCEKSFHSKLKHTIHEKRCNRDYQKSTLEEIDPVINALRDSKYKTKSRAIHEYTYQCDVCCKIFKTKQVLKQHLQLHSDGKEYTCEVCGRSFKRRDYLKTHLSTHTGERKYACQNCDFHATQRSSLIAHLKIHFRSKSYTCDVCGQTFNNSSNMLAHHRRHTNVNKYECEFCSKSFGYKISLREHIMVIHEGVKKNFLCTFCKASYNQKRSLTRHIEKKHHHKCK